MLELVSHLLDVVDDRVHGERADRRRDPLRQRIVGVVRQLGDRRAGPLRDRAHDLGQVARPEPMGDLPDGPLAHRREDVAVVAGLDRLDGLAEFDPPRRPGPETPPRVVDLERVHERPDPLARPLSATPVEGGQVPRQDVLDLVGLRDTQRGVQCVRLGQQFDLAIDVLPDHLPSILGSEVRESSRDDRERRFGEVAPLERRTRQVRDSGIAEARERLQAEAGGQTAEQTESTQQDRMMARIAVLSEVPRDDSRRQFVVVQHEARDRIAALFRIVADQPVDRPEADLGILPLREALEILPVPDPFDHAIRPPGAARTDRPW